MDGEWGVPGLDGGLMEGGGFGGSFIYTNGGA